MTPPMGRVGGAIGPALVTGNAVVWKPCLRSPCTSQMLAEILVEAGVPAGVLNLVRGDGFDVGQAIVGHRGVAAVSFTGSRAVGEHLHRAVSKRLAKVRCELGGKNPLVVLADADIELAANTVIEGAFCNAGQKRTATGRVIVEAPARKTFTETFVEKAKALKVGDARDPESFLGPVVDARQYDQVRGYIRDGVAEGARLLTGGDDGVNPVGYFVAPTVFDGVRPDMTIAREEIFGPMVALLEAVDFDAAVRLANDTEYGLSAFICTRDLGRAHAFVSRVESGVASVNLPTAGVELHAPFGGAKASGIGVKEQGRPVLESYTEWRSVYMKHA